MGCFDEAEAPSYYKRVDANGYIPHLRMFYMETTEMKRNLQAFAFVLLSVLAIAFLSGLAYAAYGTLDRIVISNASFISPGQETQVQATIYTKRSG
jgi:hypothetical protein